MSRGRVLVVDDSRIILNAIGVVLTDAGYSVTQAISPLGLTQLLRKVDPHVLLLDINMPAADGDRLLPVLQKSGAVDDTAVVFYSSLPDERLARLVKETGAAGFIQKTCDRQSLLREVSRWVGHARKIRKRPQSGFYDERKKIVVAGDVRDLIPMGPTAWNRSLFSTNEVQTAPEALEALAADEPALLVASENLPGLCGVDLCRIIRSSLNRRKVSIMVVVRREDDQERRELMRAGANAVIVGPVEAQELSRQVARLTNIASRSGLRVMVRVLTHEIGPSPCQLGWSRNLSVSGMLLETDRGLGVGSSLGVRFFLPGVSEEISNEARVTRMEPQAPKTLLAGLRFRCLSGGAREAISDFVRQRGLKTSASAP